LRLARRFAGYHDLVNIAPVVLTSLRATVSAVAGGVGNLFVGDGPVHSAELVIGDDAELPGGTELFDRGRRFDALVRLSTPSATSDFRTLCIKLPDCYGSGREQDILLSSSADGVPFHHAVLPAPRWDSRLFSSLWLYVAGVEPVVLGARADAVASAETLSAGDRLQFLLSSAIGRFRPVGQLMIGERRDETSCRFSGGNSGGGLRALPPVSFYRG
jgi:hypothetical protein